MNSFFYIIWIVLSIIVGYNLVLPVLLFLIYKIAPIKTNNTPVV